MPEKVFSMEPLGIWHRTQFRYLQSQKQNSQAESPSSGGMMSSICPSIERRSLNREPDPGAGRGARGPFQVVHPHLQSQRSSLLLHQPTETAPFWGREESTVSLCSACAQLGPIWEEMEPRTAGGPQLLQVTPGRAAPSLYTLGFPCATLNHICAWHK